VREYDSGFRTDQVKGVGPSGSERLGKAAFRGQPPTLSVPSSAVSLSISRHSCSSWLQQYFTTPTTTRCARLLAHLAGRTQLPHGCRVSTPISTHVMVSGQQHSLPQYVEGIIAKSGSSRRQGVLAAAAAPAAGPQSPAHSTLHPGAVLQHAATRADQSWCTAASSLWVTHWSRAWALRGCSREPAY
jgi:hypothetical protein